MLVRKFIFFIFISLLVFSKSNLAQAPKLLKTIILYDGHGGDDNGAVGQYEGSLRSKEKDVTLAISKKLVAALHNSLLYLLGRERN